LSVLLANYPRVKYVLADFSVCTKVFRFNSTGSIAPTTMDEHGTDTPPSVRRRQLLRGAGVGATISLAGCTGLVTNDDSESGDAGANSDGSTEAPEDAVGMALPSAVSEGSLPDGEIPVRREGVVTLVNFFATWCGPCQDEMPEFVELREAYDTDELYMVSITAEVDEGLIQQFWEDYDGSWPVAMDTELAATNEWGVTAYPTNLLFDQNGEPAAGDTPEVTTARTFEGFKQQIDPLLSEEE
jgi:thiol-disulfide isomerase/thioredoxin